MARLFQQSVTLLCLEDEVNLVNRTPGATRRRFLQSLALVAGFPLLPLARPNLADEPFPFSLSDEEWRQRLSAEQYRILRRAGTEPAGSSELLRESRSGVYVCAGCGQPLFSSRDKIPGSTDWPSFSAPINEDAVTLSADQSWTVLVRSEVFCARCGGRLGRVFRNEPEPGRMRFSMNGRALRFIPGKGGGLRDELAPLNGRSPSIVKLASGAQK
ncbi:peptide-methionine (R)-S-oxide reductase MsrB [Gilvimarinus sp. F26214L]|uniref:peptide-methionine (R)-S-oxide reductase MsrB n=1 Tax=Gilvimarinus sp. DZF01 TaxID=3461371 RepID=UPI0040456CC6